MQHDGSDATPTSAYDMAHSWLDWLYTDAIKDGRGESRIWIGGQHDSFRGRLFTGADWAARHAIELDEANTGKPWGVYHRLTTVRPVATGRGTAEDSIILPAIMMDLDLRGPGHASEAYPESEEALREILSETGIPEPSTWVNSGGGRYPVWKLSIPLDLADPEAREAAAARVRAMHLAVIDAAAARGLKVDNTSDLARVFRVPGTMNRKVEGSEVRASFDMGEAADGGLQYPITALAPRRAMPAERGPMPQPQIADRLADAGRSQSSLFDPRAGDFARNVRAFTAGQGAAFVAPFLDALRNAASGEINVRLNDASVALAHFGPEFWSREDAEKRLHDALAETDYDGRTWKAADTIRSAYRAMANDWRATLTVETAEQAQAAAAASGEQDPVDKLLGEMQSITEMISSPPPKFLIHGLLQFDSESWIIGAAGTKKSFVVFDMAARIIRGEPWQGRRTNPADVVMIIGEGSNGVGKRAKAWQQRYGVIENGEQRFYALPRPVQVKNAGAWDVLVRACERIAGRARQSGRGLLVVIDTQARVTAGINENDNGEMNAYTLAVGAIRRATEGCVLTVHHTGRAGGDARGASVIDGAQTTELKITSKGDLTGRLSVEKQKDIEQIDPIDIAFEVVDLGQDGDGEPLNSLVMCEQETVAFRAAYAGAATGEEDDGRGTFAARVGIETWIRMRAARATWQQRFAQALVDTARTTGLTRSDAYKMLGEKFGKVDFSTLRDAWEAITDNDGVWSDVVVSAGGERWTVDPMAVEKAREGVAE